jgi:RNA polymerase subunit RPABC4/transcription elongation factor Spt4
MTLLRCPGCHNMVARESATCPVCGCKFTVAVAKHIVRWAIIVVVLLWLAQHYLLHRH